MRAGSRLGTGRASRTTATFRNLNVSSRDEPGDSDDTGDATTDGPGLSRIQLDRSARVRLEGDMAVGEPFLLRLSVEVWTMPGSGTL